MSKFSVLRNNQIFMVLLGVYSHNLEETSNEFFRSFGSFYVTFTLVLCAYGCAAFVKKNWSVDVSGSLGAMKIGFAMIQSVGSFVNIGLNMSKVKAIHLQLQQFIDEMEDFDVRDIYWKCEEKCRLFTIRLGYFNIFHLSTFAFVLVKVIYDVVIGKTDTSAWNLALDLNLPIDTTNVLGWLLMWFAQMCMANCYAMSMTSVTSYFVCCSYYINAMCDHFHALMNSIDDEIKQNNPEITPKNIEESHLKIMQTLSTAIKLHINMFDKFHMLAGIFSGTIFALLPCNAGFLSLVMYDMERSFKDLDPWVFNWNLSCLLCCLFWPSLICFSATVVGVQMASIGDMAFESIWYKYHPQLRKYMILIIRRSQEPVYFTGLNLVYCNLEVFGKIIRTSCSYYIMFRTMARR